MHGGGGGSLSTGDKEHFSFLTRLLTAA